MKYLLVLLLACLAAAVQGFYAQDEVLEDDKIEINKPDSGDAERFVEGGTCGDAGGNDHETIGAGEDVRGNADGCDSSFSAVRGGDDDVKGDVEGDDEADAKRRVKRGDRLEKDSDSSGHVKRKKQGRAGASGGNAAGAAKRGDTESGSDDGSTIQCVKGGRREDGVCQINVGREGDDYFDGDHSYSGIIQGAKGNGLLGGLLSYRPPSALKIKFGDFRANLDDSGYKINKIANQKTKEVVYSVLKPTGQTQDGVFDYLTGSFTRLTLYEVLEVVRHRIQKEWAIAVFVSYLESDVFTGQRFHLKGEPSVEALLNETIWSHHISAKDFFSKLRILFRRLFSSSPSRTIVRCDYDARTVDTLLSNMPVPEVARAMMTSITKKSGWFKCFNEIFIHLNSKSTMKKLDAIRESPTYIKMRTYLAGKLNLAFLELTLDSFFGFDPALIFSVYTMI